MRTLLFAVLACTGCPSPAAPVQPSGALTAGGGGLVMTLDGKEIAITKDRFVIGGEGSDVPLAGGDCKLTAHVAVLKDSEGYRLKDLESKGFNFKKMMLDNKHIDDGDVFELCNAQLRFSLK
jgi:hypothetical protein